ncbi:MAG: helix-turn-helix domain-containing protein [Methyloceanibacter sp.]
MSERGVFAVSRSIWDDPDFAPQEFTEREAFLWLVGAAAWKNQSVRGPMGPVALERGEFCFAERFLAEKWRWSKSRVNRYLDRLEKRGIIRGAERGGSKVYSIKNYNRFQIVGLPKWGENGNELRGTSGAAPGHQRGEEETLKHSNIESVDQSELENEKPQLRKRGEDARFEEFWKAYPLKKAKGAARRVWPKALQRASFEEIIAGAKRYADERSGQDPKFTAHAASWLNAERWTDEELPLLASSAGWRRNGAGYYVKQGSEPFEAWRSHYKRLGDPRQWEFPDRPGLEVQVPSLWPRGAT